jgi:hypothetical protein
MHLILLLYFICILCVKRIISRSQNFQVDCTTCASGPKYPSWNTCSPQGALLFDEYFSEVVFAIQGPMGGLFEIGFKL